MKVKRYLSATELFRRSDRAMMSALYKKTSIVILFWVDDETRRHVAPILQRNRLLDNIQTYLFRSGSIITPLGRWSRVLAEVGHARRVGPIYTILQAVLAQWVKP